MVGAWDVPGSNPGAERRRSTGETIYPFYSSSGIPPPAPVPPRAHPTPCDPPPRRLRLRLDARGAGGVPGRRDPRRVATASARVTTRGTCPAPPRAYRPRGTAAARVRPRPRRSVFPWTCGVLAREELEPRSTSTSVKLNPRAFVSHRRNQSLSAISPRWAIADREKGIGSVPSSEWRRWNCRLELPVRDEWESGKSSAFFGFRQSRSVAR